MPPVLAKTMGAERGETVQENPVDAGIPHKALGEVVRVGSVLKMEEASVAGWTVRSALTGTKELYVGRSRMADD